MRVVLIRSIEVRVAGTGSLNFSVYSDTPGGAMALRSTDALAPTAAERAVRINLAGTVRGQLFQFKVSGTGAGRIEGIRALVRVLDPTAVYDWNWVDVPVKTTPIGYTDVEFPLKKTDLLYTDIEFPIERTSIGFSDIEIPLQGPPVEPIWVDIPVDA